MAARCLNCGYTMQTNQEVQSAVIATFHTLVDAAKKLGVEILSLLLPFGGALVAAPLNEGSHPVACPRCKATRQWEDA